MGFYKQAFLILSLSSCALVQGQTAPEIYKVTFSDKGNTPYSLSQPLDYLSPRALERRNKHGIGIDSLDLPVDPAYVQQLMVAASMDVIHTSRWFNSCTFRCTDTLGLDTLLQLPFINELRQVAGKGNRPLPEKFAQAKSETGNQYGAYYGGAYRQVTMLNTHLLHNMGARGEGILIGILDAGFDHADSLPQLAHVFDQGRVLLTRDVANEETDVYNDHWHGMSVFSTMAAKAEGDIVGTAPNASYVLLTTEFSDSEYVWEEDNWAVGAEICDSIGCDVLNTSLGYTTFEDSTQDHSFADLDGQTTIISRAAHIASLKGMIPVCSAGNSGTSAWYNIGAPADAEGILTVGAVRGDRSVADFSSRGYSADGRVKPDVCARGESAWGITPWGYNTGNINGTSFSSPITAGSVACLLQLHPEKTNTEIMQAVRESAHLYNDPNADFGYGIPDFYLAHRLLSNDPVSTDQNTLMTVFPTSFADFFTIELFSEHYQEISIDLFDMMGRQVLGKKVAIDPEHYAQVRVGSEELRTDKPGAYALRVRMGEITMHQVIIKE